MPSARARVAAAQLAADGIAAARLGAPAAVVVDRDAAGDPVFALDRGPDGHPLAVHRAGVAEEEAAGPPGRELVGNRALDLAPAAADALRADAVDPRLTATLAGLADAYELGVAAFPTVPGEPATAAARRVEITAVDGVPATDPAAVDLLTRWLRGRRPPYRPEIDVGPNTVTVGCPLA